MEPKGVGEPGVDEGLAWYPLPDALRGRRSRRFGVGMKISSGPFAYESRHEPLPPGVFSPSRIEHILSAEVACVRVPRRDEDFHERCYNAEALSGAQGLHADDQTRKGEMMKTRASSHGRGSGLSRLLFTAAGALGGIWIGSRSVKIYDWHTEWNIPAPLPVVYEAMTSREAVREWWPDMELVDDSRGEELRVGSTVSFRVHQAPEVARLAAPFQIHCLYTDVERESRLRETVKGDLSGVLEVLFHEQENGTRITFSWYVRVTNPALNLLGYVTERMYRHSHDHVMESGERGLSEYCLRRTTTN